MTLRDLPIGKTATILSVGGEGALRQHFLDMGLIPKGEVTMVKYAPMGDPMELRIHSYELTLRLADAEKIEITDVRDGVLPRPQNPDLSTIEQSKPHPGLGEGGKYHIKATENPLPDTELVTMEYRSISSTVSVSMACSSPRRAASKRLPRFLAACFKSSACLGVFFTGSRIFPWEASPERQIFFASTGRRLLRRLLYSMELVI